jgi:uncharacterized protein
MLYDLSRFRGDTDRIDRRFEPDAFALKDEEFRIVGPVVLGADLRKDARKVRLVGRVGATLECDCSRCLEPFKVPVDAAFDVMFLPAESNVAAAPSRGDREEEEEVREDDLGVSFYKDETLDLGELMREQFFLVLPMKPLCQADCQGLCPVCGINRNRETCSCRSEWVDPRMEALRNIARKDLT